MGSTSIKEAIRKVVSKADTNNIIDIKKCLLTKVIIHIAFTRGSFR